MESSLVGSCLARLQKRHVDVTGQSGDGFVSASDVADNVPGRPGGSAKWLPASMLQRLQKKSRESDECFSGEIEKK